MAEVLVSTKVTAPVSMDTWSVLSLAAVDDDEGGHREAARLGRHRVQHGADVVLLLVGADRAPRRAPASGPG